MWYRGVVADICEDDEFLIVFIDFGNSSNVRKSDIRKFPKHVKNFPPSGMVCRLTGMYLKYSFFLCFFQQNNKNNQLCLFFYLLCHLILAVAEYMFIFLYSTFATSHKINFRIICAKKKLLVQGIHCYLGIHLYVMNLVTLLAHFRAEVLKKKYIVIGANKKFNLCRVTLKQRLLLLGVLYTLKYEKVILYFDICYIVLEDGR